MGQNVSVKEIYGNNTHVNHTLPVFTDAKIELPQESVLRPNGYFPPEIIVSILTYADITTIARSSLTCKLWYESIQEVFKNMYISRYSTLESSDILEDDWKMNFYRRTLSDQNLAKGLWFAESVTAQHYPNNDFFSYVPSFYRNKMIYNMHHIHITSYSENKLFYEAFELDLDTMRSKVIPYGTVYANGYKLKTLVHDHDDAFNWKEYDIIDGTVKRNIKRKFIPPANNKDYLWRETSRFEIQVNMDGSPTVLTTNYFTNNLNSEPYPNHLEVVDLRSGELIAEPIIESTGISGFVGDYVIANLSYEVFAVNIFTNERINLGRDPEAFEFHYCKESNLFGYCEDHTITICHWPSLQVVSTFVVDHTLFSKDNPEEVHFAIVKIAFDKSKLVVALSSTMISYAIFDMQTGALVQTIFNTSDTKPSVIARTGNIHLAPNGNIITSFNNLVVYDFVSAKIVKQIPVIYAENESNEVTKQYIQAVDLPQFAVDKLEVPLEAIQHLTFFAEDKQGHVYRLTGIGSHHQDRDMWGGWNSRVPKWAQLLFYLEPWKSSAEVQNTFQLTRSTYSYPAEKFGGFNLSWDLLRKVLLVFERFNESTRTWEFTEPLAHEEILLDIKM